MIGNTTGILHSYVQTNVSVHPIEQTSFQNPLCQLPTSKAVKFDQPAACHCQDLQTKTYLPQTASSSAFSSTNTTGF